MREGGGQAQTGLNAAFVGSTDTSVLRFATTLFVTGGVIEAGATAAGGSTWQLNERGIYVAELGLLNVGGTVAFGMSYGATGSALTGDPTNNSSGMIRASLSTATGSEWLRLTATFAVTATTRGLLFRCHGTNGAGGSPSDLSLTNAYCLISRVADNPE